MKRLQNFEVEGLLSKPHSEPSLTGEGVFRVATYNVEHYASETPDKPRIKSAESKAKVRECVRAINPDIIALQEMGDVSALMELRQLLKAEGLEFPHWEHLAASDADRHIAILSKYPFAARHSHTTDTFLLNGHCFSVRRGFAEVEVQLNPNYSLTLIAVHLKSGNSIAEADPAQFRLEEAKLLRAKADAHLIKNPNARLIVLGDFNDTEDSAVLATVIGQGDHRLIDLRPAEREDKESDGKPRNSAWTHYYDKKDYYSRVDFVLMSPSMTKDYQSNESFVLATPNWGIASDHRPIVAAFRAGK